MTTGKPRSQYTVETRVTITRQEIYDDEPNGSNYPRHTQDRMEFGDTQVLPVGHDFAEAAALIAKIRDLVQGHMKP